MSELKQLSKEDVLFVAGETETVYQHIAGLVILDISSIEDFTFESFQQRIIERISRVPNFRWKLQQVPMNADLPYWVEDENFNYNNHFKRIALPSPAGREELSDLVALLYSRHLERSKPLWEIWFIEGLPDGKLAMLQKSHHCMMDGEGATQLSEILTDLEPNAKASPIAEAITNAKAGAVPSQWQMSTNAAMYFARLPGKVSASMYEFLRPKLLQQLGFGERKNTQKAIVPGTSFNGAISRERGFVFTTLSLNDIKLVKKAFGVSVNDVVLALVGTAIRNYLLAFSELPTDSLRSSIIVSLRTDEDESFSNHVTSVSLTLGTDINDPVARLRAIHAESGQVKQQAKDGGMGIIEIIQLMPPSLVNAMVSFSTADMGREMMGANLIVSNVRGSAEPLYIAGARMDAVYPMSIITQGAGVNVTCVSYVDSLGFGVTLDPDLFPHSWDFVDSLDVALQDYVVQAKKAAGGGKAAVRKKQPAMKKTVAKAKPGRKKKPPSSPAKNA